MPQVGDSRCGHYLLVARFLTPGITCLVMSGSAGDGRPTCLSRVTASESTPATVVKFRMTTSTGV